MRIVKVPGDGNCLFHSCGYLLNVSASTLRHRVAHIIQSHSSEEINGVSIRQWIINQGYAHCPKCYPIAQSGTWGSDLELSIICHLYQCGIVIHDGTTLEKIIEFYPEMERKIHLAYDGNHYDAIEL